MALSYKLLWISPLGVDGKSAFVVLREDATDEYRIVEVKNVPARYTPPLVLSWLQTNFTLAEGWYSGRPLVGRELEMWLTLWQEGDAIADIEDEIIAAQAGISAAQQDIEDINASSLPVAAKTAIQHICNREIALLNAEIAQRRREKRVIQTVIRIIRTRAPFADETPGANGGT